MKADSKQGHQHRSAGTILLTILLAGFLGGCALFSYREPTPISAVVDEAKKGTSAKEMIVKIKNAQTIYALRGSDFAKLAYYKVPPDVLDELQQQWFAQVQFLTMRWYSTGSIGGTPAVYPQPLDLDNLDQGGNGMAPNKDVAQIGVSTRPQGIPQWVPAYPPVTGPLMSPDEVVELTNSGMSTDEIVKKVLGSRVHPLYVENSFKVARFRTAALTGSMFANFAEKGVAYEVLDALQAVYLSQHIERQRYNAPRGTGGYP
ncbi:MAG: hypothetical protein PVH25_07390 [Burkholderiales bacterium]|jgi:hypothetical protein